MTDTFGLSVGSTSCRSIARDALGSTPNDTRFCGWSALWLSSTTSVVACSRQRSRVSKAAWRLYGSCGREPSRLSADRPVIPARPFGRRQEDGRFRPAGGPVATRPGRLGQSQPGIGGAASHLLGRQDHAAEARRAAAVHGVDEPGLPASFRRGTAGVSRRCSWRLPESVATALVLKPFLELCRRYSMPAKPCKTNLITTP